MNWSNIFNMQGLAGAIRGAAPDVAASVDQGKNIQSLVESRQFQDLLNRARLADLERKRQWAAEDRASLSPEERRQKMLDPAGYRHLRKRKDEPDNFVEAAEKIGKIEKARSEFGDDEIPDDVAMFFDDATAETIKSFQKKPKDIVAEAFGSGKSSGSSSGGMTWDQSRAAMNNPHYYDNKAGIEKKAGIKNEAGIENVTDILKASGSPVAGTVLDIIGKFARKSQPESQPIDNRNLFAGGVDPFEQQGPPAPETFADLGIGDAQTQQIFVELEAKIPNLRNYYASDPEAYKRLFAAINSGKITQAEAISMIEKSQQL